MYANDAQPLWSPFGSTLGGLFAETQTAAFGGSDFSSFSGQTAFTSVLGEDASFSAPDAFGYVAASFAHPDTLGNAMDGVFPSESPNASDPFFCNHGYTFGAGDAMPIPQPDSLGNMSGCAGPSFPKPSDLEGVSRVASAAPNSSPAQSSANVAAESAAGDGAQSGDAGCSGPCTDGFFYGIDNYILYIQPTWPGWDLNSQPPLQATLASVLAEFLSHYAATYGVFGDQAPPSQEPAAEIVEITEFQGKEPRNNATCKCECLVVNENERAEESSLAESATDADEAPSFQTPQQPHFPFHLETSPLAYVEKKQQGSPYSSASATESSRLRCVGCHGDRGGDESASSVISAGEVDLTSFDASTSPSCTSDSADDFRRHDRRRFTGYCPMEPRGSFYSDSEGLATPTSIDTDATAPEEDVILTTVFRWETDVDDLTSTDNEYEIADESSTLNTPLLQTPPSIVRMSDATKSPQREAPITEPSSESTENPLSSFLLTAASAFRNYCCFCM